MIQIIFLIVVIILMVLIAFFAISIVFLIFQSDLYGAPFVDNKKNVIKSAIELLDLKPGDNFCDLGCGSGHVIKYVSDKYPNINVTGIEVAFIPYWISKLRLFKYRKDPRVKIVRADIRKYDFTTNNKIYMYLFPELIAGMISNLEKVRNTKKSIIVTCVFAIPNMKPSTTRKVFHVTFKKDVNLYRYSDE